MSYEQAFAAVEGVTVEWCKYIGSYSGTLLAKLSIAGQEGPRYVLSEFGSCSGCDAYEAEFDWDEPTAEQLASFARTYIDAALTLDEVIAKLLPKPDEWYDDDDRVALDRVLQDYPERAALVRVMPQGVA